MSQPPDEANKAAGRIIQKQSHELLDQTIPESEYPTAIQLCEPTILPFPPIYFFLRLV